MRTLLVAVILAFSTGVAVVNADNDRVVTKNALPDGRAFFCFTFFIKMNRIKQQNHNI